MAVDLHIHTNVSDGVYSPAEVVEQALQASLEAIAITDHDIIDGVIMAQNAATGANIEIIPGIELSAAYKQKDVHILGYYMDLTNSEFLDHLSVIRNVRKNRVISIIEKLFALGIKLDLNEIVQDADNTVICRSHVARAMVASGAVKTKKEAFKRYIGLGKSAYVPRETISPPEAIHLILVARGVPVLAHPGSEHNNANFIKELINVGLKGIEVYHREHDAKQTKMYTKIAQQNGLIMTGGSDFHGSRSEYNHPIGSFSVGYQTVEELKKLASFHNNVAYSRKHS